MLLINPLGHRHQRTSCDCLSGTSRFHKAALFDASAQSQCVNFTVRIFFNKLYILFVLSLGRDALFCAWVCVQGCSCAFLCECVCLCAIHTFHRFKERSWWEYFYNRAVLLCLHTRRAPWRRSDWHNELSWAVCTSQHVSTTSQNLNKFTNSHEALVLNVGKLVLLWSTDVIIKWLSVQSSDLLTK